MAEVALLERATRHPVFSLQTISLLYFSTTILCNNQELVGLITKCIFKEDLSGKLAIKNGKAYKIVEAKVNELFELFSKIPGICKRMILELLWPVTYRIIQWKSVYTRTIKDNFLQCFYWTHQGRIDNKRTAKYIIENKMIPISKRFMLACSLCLSKEIHDLWKNMSVRDKLDLLKTDWEKIDLVVYWFSKLVGKEDNEFGECFQKALSCAVEIGSIEAIKYFFSIIPENAKSDKAVFCSNLIIAKLKTLPFLEEVEGDMAYFILLQMTETHQKTFFKSHLSVVLLLLLYFPGQKEFLEVLKGKLDATSEEDIEHVLLLITYKLILDTFKDYDYQDLFVSVWEILNDSYKNYLRESLILEGCFCLLIWNYFRFLLTKRPRKKKNRARKQRSSEKIIRFNQDKWELLHFFIKNEIVTTESLTNHRFRVLQLLRTRRSDQLAWRRLMKFVNDNRTE